MPTEHITGANVLSEPKRKNVSSALTQRHEANMVNTNKKQKQKLYTRESKDKEKQFIKYVIGKNKKVNSTKRGMKFDLESELNDIDVMLDEMNTGGKGLTKDSTDEVVDLNKQDDMEVEVEAIGICTFGSNHETNEGNEIEIKRENKEITHNISQQVTDSQEEKEITHNVGQRVTDGQEEKEITDNIGQQVTDGQEEKEITDNVDKTITDGKGGKQITDNVNKITDGKGGKQVTDNVDKTISDGEGRKQITDNVDKITDGEGGKQITDNVDKTITDGEGGKQVTENIDKITDGEGGKQIAVREKEDSDDTESGDETDPISIDKSFSKVCSTFPSNPESSSSNNEKEDTEEESDNENNCAVAKNITKNGNRKKN